MSVSEETKGQGLDEEMDGEGIVYGPVNRPREGPDSSTLVVGDPPTDVGTIADADTAKPPLLKDVEDPNALLGACGLQNLGNTCYMNAGLQCLRSIPSLVRCFLEESHPALVPLYSEKKEDKLLVCKGHLASRFRVLLQKLWSCRYSSVRPRAFKTTLGVRWNHFSDNRQHDCQEFMSVFLDSLHDDLQGHVQHAEEMEVDPITISNTLTNHSAPNDTLQNTSVITDTFRGMLKSEVVCHACSFSSIKEEPFFFLSVPIPHACECQIEVLWVPLCTQMGARRAVRVLVTVMNYGTVEDIKKSMISIAGLCVQCDLVLLAEVKDSAIQRIVTDSMLVKNISANTKLYAFEMASVGQPPPPQPAATPSHDVNRSQESGVKAADMATPSANAPSPSADASPPSADAPPPSTDAPPLSVGAPPSLTDAPPPSGVRSVVMEWHSCGICLEEMVDSDLLTHKECGAILCAVCLLASSEHSAQGDHIQCPICTVMVKPSEAFVPLSTPSKDAIIRLLQTNIMFRSDNSPDRPTVFGHPAILNLPSSGPASLLHDAVRALVPPTLIDNYWTLHLTDSKGIFCSRCMFQKGCKGCEVADTDVSIDLKPGDHLSVTFYQLEQESIKQASEAQSHLSLQTKRLSQATLSECLGAFSQREVLSWFCPQCKCDREATKVLFPCVYPKTLIVHLKRFLYHNMGVKVESPVLFPLTLETGGRVFHLVGCVCHFGSLNCGHYTAYSLNPVTKEWYYYNDETVTKEAPSDKDAQNVYLLFYADEQDLLPLLPFKLDHVVFNDEDEATVVEQLVKTFQPPPPPQTAAPPPQAAEPLPQVALQLNSTAVQPTDTRATSSDAHLPSAVQSDDASTREHMDTTITMQTAAVTDGH